MAKFIGRLVNVGIGKESARGTAVNPTFWVPKMELSHNDKIQQVVDESSLGVIEDAQDASIVQKYSEGELKGRVLDDSFGLWLLASIGSVSSAVVGGESLVYDHTFSVLESGQHPSLTIGVKDPNAGTGFRYALSMIESLEVNAELNRYVEMSVKYRGNVNASGTITPSYSTTSKFFLPQHGEVKFATTQAGLGAASAISVKKATFSITKNIEDDQVIGNLGVADRLNKQFAVEGTIELMYEDRNYIDTIMLGDAARALRIKFTNTDSTIGTASNPTMTFDFHKVKLSEVALVQGNSDFVRQTLSFKAYYSTTDSKMLTFILRNLTTSY